MVQTKEFVRVIYGPFSEEFFWYDDSESDPELYDYDNDHLSPQSNDSWGWDEWGDLVVFRPVGLAPRYSYPLILWLSLDDFSGVTLRDWFPDLSDRNYLGAEVQLDPGMSVSQNANRISQAIREVAAQYQVHRNRIWIAGVGAAADWVLRLLPDFSGPLTGGIAIAPTERQLIPGNPAFELLAETKTIYLATESEEEREAAEVFSAAFDFREEQIHVSHWESLEASRLEICRDLNVWLMQQVCAPAGLDSRG